MRLHTWMSMVFLGLCCLGAEVRADQGGRPSAKSRLTPPEGAPLPEARGQAQINPNHLMVKVQGLPEGVYTVLLDDGTGNKVAIGEITIPAVDSEDGEGEDGDDDEDDDEGGLLKLSVGGLPFGADQPADLGGRAVCVNDSEGTTLLTGTTPNAAAKDHSNRSGRCPLSRPDPAPDADAEGQLKLESGGDRIVIKVGLSNLEPGAIYEVILTNPGGTQSESIGMATADEGGEAELKVDSAKGDPIPFGVADATELVGYGISVQDASDAVVLTGTVCEPRIREDHGGGGGPKGPRCFSAVLSGTDEVPPVDTAATGTAQFSLAGPDKLKLVYEVTVEGLSGPAVAAHIHPGAAGEEGPPLVTLDHETLSGSVQITPEQALAIQTTLTYVNVHTEANPEGEIRGQLAVCLDDDDDGDDEDDGDDGETEEEEGGEEGPEERFLALGEFDAAFLRGDSNADGSVNIADAVSTLSFLFTAGVRPYCLDAADANDDGTLDISDPIALLGYLFLGDTPLPYPGVVISGSDATPDALYCSDAS